MTNGVAPAPADGMGFAEWLAQVLARWKVIAWTVVIIVTLTIVTSLVSDPVFRGRASFIAIPNKGGSLSGSAGGLASLLGGTGASGLASSFGIGLSSDPTTSPEFYKELVASRELLTHLAIAQYKDPRKPPEGHGGTATLVEIIGPKKWPTPERRLEQTLLKLGKLVRASPDTKTNLITITADFQWPDLAARVANHASALVDTFNVQQRQSRARARRLFAEAQVQDAQASLRAAEDRLRDFQQTNRQYSQSPDLMFEQTRLRRQVEVEQEVYLGVRREFETSKLDEVNDVPVIAVVDSAVAPTYRQWPKRTIMTLASVVIGLFLGVLIAGALALFSGWAQRNPSEADELRVAIDDLTRSLPLRRRVRAPVTDDR